MARKLSKKRTQVQKIVKKVQTTRSSKSSTANSNTPAPVFSIPNTRYTESVGRRKVATARVRIFDKPGDFVVNDTLVSDYFAAIPMAPARYNLPFDLTDLKGKYAVVVRVSGSGISAQLDAVIHGLSRALVKINPDLKSVLKERGLMTRDDRMKETRKIGMGGKARRQRQSPKR